MQLKRVPGHVLMRYFAWVILAFAVCTAGCAGRVRKEKFENVYRAAKAVEGALGVGVNLPKFTELVQTFSTEVSIAADTASNSTEKTMVGLYREALAAYQDSLTVWQKKIGGHQESLGIANDPELRRIVETYPIGGRGRGESFTFEPDDAIRNIWTYARGKADAANSLFNGESVSDVPAVPR